MNMGKIFLFCFLLVIFFSAGSKAEVVTKVVAIINGEVITDLDVSRLLDPIAMQYKTIYAPEELDKKIEEIRSKLIKDLIDDRLLLSEAKKEGVAAEEDEINKKLEELRAKFASKEDFENAIFYQNLTIGDLKERFKNEIIKGKLINEKIRRHIQITPLEVRKYYDTYQKEFNQPETVNLRTIFIKKGKQSKEIAENILRLLKSGADFKETAKQYSNATNADSGGDLGEVKKGQYKEDIDNAIFNLKEGEISNLVETNAGFYIFRVEKKNLQRLMDFNEVKDMANQKLYMQKAQAKLVEYLENLKKHAYITVK